MTKQISKKGKRLFALLLAAVMMVSIAPIPVSAATTNSDGYIEIRTIEELYGVRNDLTANYILMNDIDLTEATAPGGDWDFNGYGWNPIGSNDNYSNSLSFSGVFDGNGYAIKGMRIEHTAASNTYFGLFSCIGDKGVVRNLKISGNITMLGKSCAGYAGSVAATCYGTIENVISSVEFTGPNNARGGIIADASDNAQIINCAFVGCSTGGVTMNGGIAGRIEDGCVVSGCYNSASLLGATTGTEYVGGIVGYIYDVGYSGRGKIINCYNSGDMEESASESGGILGYSNDEYVTVSNCYSVGYAKYGIGYGRSISNCYYFKNPDRTYAATTYGTALNEAQLTIQNVYSGFDFNNIWIINAEAAYPYPQLRNNIEDLRIIEGMTLTSGPNKTEYAYGEPLDLSGAELTVVIRDDDDIQIPVTDSMVDGYDATTPGRQTITVTYKGRTVTFEVVVKERVYTPIYTIEDLYNIRKDMAGYYILMNDIDLTDATAAGGNWDFMGNGWNPIGSADIYSGANAFSGIFDGNGKKIIGLRIDLTTIPSDAGSMYCGLFAKVSGTVKDLTFVESNVRIGRTNTGYSNYAGTICGSLKGTIENCHVDGSVNGFAAYYDNIGYTYGGGLAGVAGSDAEITLSSMRGAVTASNSARKGIAYAGGISGHGGIITQSYNNATISAKNTYTSSSSSSSVNYDGAYAGGISNYATVTNCYNNGDVNASTEDVSVRDLHASGISSGADASLNKITNCYNIGKTTYSLNYNSMKFKGFAIGDGTNTNCYYLANTGVNTAGATSLTEGQALTQSMYAALDFETVWQQNPNAIYPYPQLRSNIQDARVITNIQVATLPDQVVYDYNEALDLTGCTLGVTMDNGDEEFVDVTEDMVTGYDALTPGVQTLTVRYLGYELTLSVTVSEKIYIPISTVEDLYNVRLNLNANYILMNDIDLTEATAPGGAYDFMGNGWNPIGSNDIYGNQAFAGEFDGNGHKIIGMRMDVTTLPSGVGNSIYLGLFAKISGQVYDLTFDGGTIITSTYIAKSKYAGTLAGCADSAVFIDICSKMDDIDIKMYYSLADFEAVVGGVVGSLLNSQMTRCVNATDVVAYASNREYTKCSIAGGLVGNASTSSILLSYNTGTVTAGNDGGVNYAGGIVGYSDSASEIADSYNTGAVRSSTASSNYAAGISYYGTIKRCYNIGQITTIAAGTRRPGIGGSSVTDSYYLTDSGVSSTGATSLTELQMRTQSMYPGFDFENTWILNEYANHPYPQLRSNVQDLEESAALVSIISWPLKQEYYTGDELVLDGCMIDVTYVSGRKELLSVTADMISGYDNTTDGEQTVTVTYRGSSDTFPVTVKARPVVTGVELISLPTTTEFRVGTAFDFTGAKIRVSYEGGATEELDVTEDMVTGANIHHLGKQTLTVTYYGMSDTFEVTVTSVSIAELRLDATPDKLVYLEKEALDLTGMVLTAVMNNGTENEIASGYLVSGYSSVPGTHMVTVSYMGKSVSFMVTVKSKTVVDLKLQAVPTKREYVAGEAFNAAGMMIVATYDNGDVEVVEDYELTGFDAVPGLKTVVAGFEGKYVAFTVSVIARVITDFNITSYPAKLEYLQYDAFDPTGLEVKATYNDGLTEIITDYKLVGYSSNPGTHTVSVAYEGWVKTFEVTVSPRQLTNLVVVAPTKLTYYLSEEFDATGLMVTACYNNGQQVVVEDYSMSGFDSNTPGTKTITIGYGGLTSEFSVSVSERSEIVTEGSFTVGNLVGRLGDTVVIPVSVNKNTGIAGFTHTITFDATNLKFVSAAATGIYANGTMVVNDEKAAEGEINVLWIGASDVVNNGDVYNLTFEVLETATDGISDITISFDENDNGNISGENVLFGTVDGYVDIRSYWLGDLDGDRKYAMVDLLQLAQYVSGKEMTLTDKQKLSADVNEDGNIDIHDVIMLNQWLLVADM